MDYRKIYKEKLTTPEEAVKVVKNGDWVDYSQTCSFPRLLDKALSERSAELSDVKIRSAIDMIPIQVVENAPCGAFTYNLWHCTGIGRKYVDQGKAFYNPMLFRHCGVY